MPYPATTDDLLYSIPACYTARRDWGLWSIVVLLQAGYSQLGLIDVRIWREGVSIFESVDKIANNIIWLELTSHVSF